MTIEEIKSKILNLWNIIYQFTKREAIAKYKGSYLGFAWTFITPLIMLIVYTFVFGQIFQSKWQVNSSNPMEFSLILFCGLTVYNIFSETISRAPQLIITNVNYVKKVVFPLEIFPFVSLGSALVNGTVNFILLLIFQLLITGKLYWTLVLFPIVLLPLLIMIIGISWFLSSLGVFLRDIGYVITISIQALMLLSPIFYPSTSVPDQFQWFFQINPIAYFVEAARAVVLFGEIPQIITYLKFLLSAILISFLGYWWFRRTKSGFSDVL